MATVTKGQRVIVRDGSAGTVLSSENDERAYVRLDSGVAANFPVEVLTPTEDKDLRPAGLEYK